MNTFRLACTRGASLIEHRAMQHGAHAVRPFRPLVAARPRPLVCLAASQKTQQTQPKLTGAEKSVGRGELRGQGAQRTVFGKLVRRIAEKPVGQGADGVLSAREEGQGDGHCAAAGLCFDPFDWLDVHLLSPEGALEAARSGWKWRH